MSYRIGGPKPPSPRFTSPQGRGPNAANNAARVGEELFDKLLPLSYKGVCVPCSSIKVTIAHDLAQHKYWGVDGARVEATGVAPLVIEAEIPFVNGIVPGKNEQWGDGGGDSAGTLYPFVFRKFLAAFNEKRWGILVHPEFDQIPCKAESLEYKLDGNIRDGCEVTCKWIQTVIRPSDDGAVPVGDPLIKEARVAAKDLDASKTDLLKLVPDMVVPDTSFEDLLDQATGVIDGTVLAVNQLRAKPLTLLAHAQRLRNSLERAKNALTWQAEQNAEKIAAAALALINADTKTTVSAKGKVAIVEAAQPGRIILKFSVPVPLTASQAYALARKRGGRLTMREFIELNAAFVSRPVVQAGTRFRYYVDV